MVPPQVPFDNLVRHRNKRLVRTLAAFDARLFAHPFPPPFAQAGAYPPFPVFRLSQRIGNTSSRPAKRRRNSATFVNDDEAIVTGGGAGVFNPELAASKTTR